MEDTLEHMQLLSEGAFGLTIDPPSCALAVALDDALTPPCYEREFRVVASGGTPPYTFTCTPSSFPDDVEFVVLDAQLGRAVLRVYAPLARPPVHPFR